jgi:iron-sulfur cluster assembly protein
MSLTLSERAANEVKRMIREQELPETTALRVSVAGGGCSGFEYRLSFDSQPNEAEDAVTQSHGVQVVVDPKSARFLTGTEIDIHEGLDKRGFVFNNPLAVRTCGCGSSFQI